MKKGDKIFLMEGEISAINHFIKVLGTHVKKFEAAYIRKDSREFNSLKKGMIQIQRKIHSIVK